ncbi:MAG: hypothetical protein LBR77_02205 [Lachnospiraceae bacterium]|jgi:hypothetical protein|nr:hypothetical protein [Lachnospiraceae bacterium]
MNYLALNNMLNLIPTLGILLLFLLLCIIAAVIKDPRMLLIPIGLQTIWSIVGAVTTLVFMRLNRLPMATILQLIPAYVVPIIFGILVFVAVLLSLVGVWRSRIPAAIVILVALVIMVGGSLWGVIRSVLISGMGQLTAMQLMSTFSNFFRYMALLFVVLSMRWEKR